MKLFFEYLRLKIKTLILLLSFFVIFALSFMLFRLPLPAVIYPAVLCFISGILYMIIDFRSFSEKHRELDNLTVMRSFLISELPEEKGIIDSDYLKIIALLRDELEKSETASAVRYRNMTEYYTVWAHQIKTPIASMKLTLQNEDSELSRRLTSELFRIEQYVEMVLTFLRLDSPSTDYVFNEYALDLMIKNTVRKFANDFISKKLSLEYEETGISFVTDEKWFSFVLEQLISNAIKYTREGGIRIYAQGKKLFIEDSGIGIAPEDIPRIFENGYTGINGRGDKSASGIGLYLCKRVCDNLGVGISAQSSPEGTKICLDITS